MSVLWPLAAVLVLQHLGPLHAQEKVLTYLVAFVPFVVLGVVVWVRHRQDAPDHDAESA